MSESAILINITLDNTVNGLDGMTARGLVDMPSGTGKPIDPAKHRQKAVEADQMCARSLVFMGNLGTVKAKGLCRYHQKLISGRSG